MDKKEDGNIVVIFSAEKENNSLKGFAKLVLLFDNKRNNKT